MELDNIKFYIKKKIIKHEKEEIENAYANFFGKLYGQNYEEKFKYCQELDNNTTSKYLKYYSYPSSVISSIIECPNIYLLKILGPNNNYLGYGRIMVKSDVASVMDIAFCPQVSKDYENKIWKKAITFIEEYFTSLNIKKIYLEIPMNEIAKLKRAYIDLGYIENAEDIMIMSDSHVYYLNKTIERKS